MSEQGWNDFYAFTTGGDAKTLLRRLAQLIGSQELLYREHGGDLIVPFTAAGSSEARAAVERFGGAPRLGERRLSMTQALHYGGRWKLSSSTTRSSFASARRRWRTL